MRIVGLLRCSTPGQSATSIPEQRAAIEGFARKHSHQIVAWAEQPGMSGFWKTRKQVQANLRELWRYIFHPPVEYDGLVFYDESRLLRGPIALGFWLEQEAGERGITFINIHRPPCGADDLGENVQKVVERQAAYDFSRMLAEKSVLGARHACSLGYRVGGAAPLGYVRVVYRNGKPATYPDGSIWKLRAGERKPNSREYKVRLHPDESTAPIVRSIFTSFCAGDGLGSIARTLNSSGTRRPSGKPWTKALVRSVLLDPTCRGAVVYHRHKPSGGEYDRADWTTCEDAHERLCTREQAAYVDARLGSSERRIIARRSDRFLLNGGLMRCAQCNSHLIGWVRGSGCRPVYACAGYKHNTTDCDEYFPVDACELETAVLREIAKLCEDGRIVSRVTELISQCDGEARELASLLPKIEKQLSNVADAIARVGMDSALESRLRTLNAEKLRVEQELSNRRLAADEPQRLLNAYREMHRGLVGSDRLIQRQILRCVISGPIIVDPQQRLITARIGGGAGTLPVSGKCPHSGTRYGIRTRDLRRERAMS